MRSRVAVDQKDNRPVGSAEGGWHQFRHGGRARADYVYVCMYEQSADIAPGRELDVHAPFNKASTQVVRYGILRTTTRAIMLRTAQCRVGSGSGEIWVSPC